jgi:hypothetical protein
MQLSNGGRFGWWEGLVADKCDEEMILQTEWFRKLTTGRNS